MKIAQIASVMERVPPKTYGGTERVVYALTEELISKGHDVTLFASGDSSSSAKLKSIIPKSLRRENQSEAARRIMRTIHVGFAYQHSHEFDIIHDHNGYLSLPAAMKSKTPVIMTLHNNFDPYHLAAFKLLQGPSLVSISKKQVQGKGLKIVGNVYNGYDMSKFPFSQTHEGYLLYVGRISPEKGVHIAMDVAKKVNLPLIIAAKLDNADMQYFRTHIKPRLSKTIRWIGEVNEQQRNILMSKAMCFLHPVRWDEPFGLTLIEAMACGCPVVAFERGSIPEVITHGKTGFVVRNEQHMVAAVKNIEKIRRADCRAHALRKFNAQKMASGYERLYEKIVSKSAIHSVSKLLTNGNSVHDESPLPM